MRLIKRIPSIRSEIAYLVTRITIKLLKMGLRGLKKMKTFYLDRSYKYFHEKLYSLSMLLCKCCIFRHLIRKYCMLSTSHKKLLLSFMGKIDSLFNVNGEINARLLLKLDLETVFC